MAEQEQIGNAEALAKYLTLERENKRLVQENRLYYAEIEKLRKHYGELSGKINTLWDWLETRENTKTETIRRKFAETFKFAYMEAKFEDLIAKWSNKESREFALAELRASKGGN